MKNIAILGSTGSIGRNALKIVEMFPQHFTVKALAAKSNISLLAKQVAKFDPDIAVVYDGARAQQLKEKLPAAKGVDIVYGEEGYCEAAAHPSVDITVTAVVGAAGLAPTLAAIDAGKTVALANKETLVMAGDIVIRRATQKGIQIRPIDSEHSAIFQCLEGQRREDVANILLTASGGPFLNFPAHKFDDITVEAALDHPNWQMGRKITIDSATMMNKGLEVLEAKHLFGVPHDRIGVVIHPQSVIHSMVAYRDGSVLAQLGIPDMKGAIAYALSYPQRLPLNQPLPDFSGASNLTFQDPDLKRFPCLALAYNACEVGGSMPAVLNAANEVAVHAFLDRMISFVDIASVVRQTMAGHRVSSDPILDDIIAADRWARKWATKLVDEFRN
ncbi:MAG: 1-deoxy-D-xylulose-5-phosphate reductoisomerase [Desulfobacterales bacterium]|jgi:1-deoxy-D-xylulose-5-phosphate reductoisomerase